MARSFCENCPKTGHKGSKIRTYKAGRRSIDLCYPCYLKLKRMNHWLEDAIDAQRKET